MTDRELLERVLAEYDENMLRTPSFVTMEEIRRHLAQPHYPDWAIALATNPDWAVGLATNRGYDAERYAAALVGGDQDAIALTHPYNWLTEEEVERLVPAPQIECLCGDIFPTVNAMDQHIHIVHTDPDAVE